MSEQINGNEVILNQFLKIWAGDSKKRYNIKKKVFRKGQRIFNEDENVRGLFFIAKGLIKIVKSTEDGKELIMTMLRPGEFLGCKEVVSGLKYTSTAMAIKESELSFMAFDDFRELTKTDPVFYSYLINKISSDLIETEGKLVNLACKPVKGRLADVLLNFVSTGKLPMSINLTRSDLAGLTYTATETVVRLLSEFKKDHLIELNGKEITVTNTDGLIKLSRLFQK